LGSNNQITLPKESNEKKRGLKKLMRENISLSEAIVNSYSNDSSGWCKSTFAIFLIFTLGCLICLLKCKKKGGSEEKTLKDPLPNEKGREEEDPYYYYCHRRSVMHLIS